MRQAGHRAGHGAGYRAEREAGRAAFSRRRWLEALRLAAVALLLPGVALVLLPGRWGTALPGPMRLSLGVLPPLLLPVLEALRRMPPGQARAAAGLGADRIARLRLLWLPQLGPACLCGVLLAAALLVAGLLGGAALSRPRTAAHPPARAAAALSSPGAPV